MTALPGDRDVQIDAVYSERNRLVAALAHLFGNAAWRGLDPESPDFTVVYIDLPTGQVSWHIPDAEMTAFPPLPLRAPTGWDGHGTDEKYRRLAALRRGDICRDVQDAVIRAVNHERGLRVGADPGNGLEAAVKANDEYELRKIVHAQHDSRDSVQSCGRCYDLVNDAPFRGILEALHALALALGRDKK